MSYTSRFIAAHPDMLGGPFPASEPQADGAPWSSADDCARCGLDCEDAPRKCHQCETSPLCSDCDRDVCATCEAENDRSLERIQARIEAIMEPADERA